MTEDGNKKPKDKHVHRSAIWHTSH